MSDVSAPHRGGARGAPSLPSRILELIASGQAVTRTELAERLGVAASTISIAVGQLVERGLVAEHGTRASGGGRPRKILRLGGAAVRNQLVGPEHLPRGAELQNQETLPAICNSDLRAAELHDAGAPAHCVGVALWVHGHARERRVRSG